MQTRYYKGGPKEHSKEGRRKEGRRCSPWSPPRNARARALASLVSSSFRAHFWWSLGVPFCGGLFQWPPPLLECSQSPRFFNAPFSWLKKKLHWRPRRPPASCRFRPGVLRQPNGGVLLAAMRMSIEMKNRKTARSELRALLYRLSSWNASLQVNVVEGLWQP